MNLASPALGSRGDALDDHLRIALQEMSRLATADDCALFTLPDTTGQTEPSLPPWVYEKVVKQRTTLALRRPEDVPAEAQADRRYLVSAGIRSALYIPYEKDRVVRHVLALTSSGELGWSEELVERLRALGALAIHALDERSVIAAQTRAREALRAMKRFSQATLDAVNEHVAVIDAEGRLVETSSHWRKLADGSAANPERVPVGGNYLAACDAALEPQREWTARLAQGIRQVLRGETDRFTMESARPSRAGTRWIHTRVRRFVVDGASFAAVSHEDITARRMSEQELQSLRAEQWHAERITRTGVLVASLAHELSQPITAVLSNAQAAVRFFARDAVDPEEIRQILADIVADSKRAGEIIESLRIMLLRQKAERGPVEVDRLVLDVIRLLHSEFIRQQVEVQQEIAPGCVVLGDRGQLQQVVLNLMMNAIEAMLPMAAGARRLKVTVSRKSRTEVLIAVRDSGIGITRDELKRMFGAFWTTKSRGMGMGLAICHSIVESHGGRIRAERNEGLGSTFFVVLPAAADIPMESASQ